MPNGRAWTAGPLAAQTEATVFTAGRLWDEGKGLAVLDRAAATLQAEVLAAGPTTGPNGATIALAHIKASGPLSEAAVAAHLARRPIYASPALYEPFGLAILEAAQAGCPLVLSDIPSFRDLWDGAALFVAARDPAAWAAALAGLLGDAGRRDALGRAARDRAGAYTVEAMVAGTRAVHDAVLASAAAHAA